MIVIRLMGGLGNQLFQFALGRALKARGRDVVYDTSSFEQDPCRRYLLSDLGLELPLGRPSHGSRHIHEGSMRFNPAVFDYDYSVYLDGYWQSEKYFAYIGEQLRDEMFQGLVTSQQTQWMAHHIQMKGENSCFLHVRRSDNLRPTSILYQGLADAVNAPYYVRAVKKVLETVPAAHFFVFSDDPVWLKANFKNPHCTIVDHNLPSFTSLPDHNLRKNELGREVEDFYLMSLCRHAVVANSTFSWWAAWLNREEEKGSRIVTAPDPWFSGGDLDATDILPSRWVKVNMR